MAVLALRNVDCKAHTNTDGLANPNRHAGSGTRKVHERSSIGNVFLQERSYGSGLRVGLVPKGKAPGRLTFNVERACGRQGPIILLLLCVCSEAARGSGGIGYLV